MKITGIPDFDFDLLTFAGGEVPVWDPGTKTFVGMTVAQALGFTPENAAQKNQANGYAGLSAASKLAASQLPNLPNRQAIDIGATSGVVSGVLMVDTTAAQTDANTTEKTLWTYTLPAGAMNANGRVLRVKAFGQYAANANSKTATLKLGSNTLQAETVTSNNLGFQMTARIIRTAASGNPSSIILRDRAGGGGSTTSLPITTSSDWSLAQVLSFTAQNGTANAGDIQFKGAIVEVLN